MKIKKVKKAKARVPFVFTKARAFKMRNKVLPRKAKHKASW